MAQAASGMNRCTHMFSPDFIELLRLFLGFHTMKKLIFGALDVFWLNFTQESPYFQATTNKSNWS